MPVDRLLDVVEAAQACMLKAFNPDDPIQPPLGGGSKVCRVLAGDAIAIELWDAHAEGSDCQAPFIWVRVCRRYLTETFPTPSVNIKDCSGPEVAELEFGVGRCTKVSEVVDWDEQAIEAAVALDDSWRLGKAACCFRAAVSEQDVGVGTSTPYGPEGGVVGWTTQVFVSI